METLLPELHMSLLNSFMFVYLEQYILYPWKLYVLKDDILFMMLSLYFLMDRII